MSGFNVDPRQVLRSLQQIDRSKDQVENQSLRAGAKVLQERMSSNVNRSNVNKKDRVHLQDDIKISRTKERDGKKYVEVGPSLKTRWRARFLEFGTSKMSARPFVEKSAVESEQEILNVIEDVLRKKLKL